MFPRQSELVAELVVFVALSSCELEEPGPEAWRLNLWAVVEPQVPVLRSQAGPEAETARPEY